MGTHNSKITYKFVSKSDDEIVWKGSERPERLNCSKK